jgi:hypothetical protein
MDPQITQYGRYHGELPPHLGDIPSSNGDNRRSIGFMSVSKGWSDVELQPGELAAVEVTGRDEIFGPPTFAIAIEGIADIGTFDPTSGEVGLYLGNDFDNPDAIVSHVEWGSSGHGRSGTAVAAQIWPDGGFVETSELTGAILATLIPPTDPEHWTSGG